MYEEAIQRVKDAEAEPWVKVHQFISRMEMAYAAADVVISRAGAIAISELCASAKPVILIPSPNVAEDHQTKNAMALVNKGAALMVSDHDCHEKGLPLLKELLDDKQRQATMKTNIHQMSHRNAAAHIVKEMEKLLKTLS